MCRVPQHGRLGLLPRGFDKTSASPDAGPYTVEVELLYQTIGYRWADNLSVYDAPEPKRFVSYFRSMAPGWSVVVATATAKSEGSPASAF